MGIPVLGRMAPQIYMGYLFLNFCSFADLLRHVESPKNQRPFSESCQSALLTDGTGLWVLDEGEIPCRSQTESFVGLKGLCSCSPAAQRERLGAKYVRGGIDARQTCSEACVATQAGTWSRVPTAP